MPWGGGARALAAVYADSDIRWWNDMHGPLRIGVIGDFEPSFLSHFATNAALYDAAASVGIPLQIRWLPTPSLDGPNAATSLSQYAGLIASPGSPYKSFHGMLRGIEFARTHDVVFGGT